MKTTTQYTVESDWGDNEGLASITLSYLIKQHKSHPPDFKTLTNQFYADICATEERGMKVAMLLATALIRLNKQGK